MEWKLAENGNTHVFQTVQYSMLQFIKLSLFAHHHLIEVQLKDALQGDKILKLKN